MKYETICIRRQGLSLLHTEGADFAAKVTYHGWGISADAPTSPFDAEMDKLGWNRPIEDYDHRVVSEWLVPKFGCWGE